MAQNLGDKHWYIVTTYSGNEAKTAENLQNRIKTMNMEAFIFRVLVAEFQEKVISSPSTRRRARRFISSVPRTSILATSLLK